MNNFAQYSDCSVNKVFPRNMVTVFATGKDSNRYAKLRKQLEKIHALAPNKNVVIETKKKHGAERRLLVIKTSNFKLYESELIEVDKQTRC